VKDLGVLSYIVRFTNITSLLKRAPESYADAFNYGQLEVDIKEKSATIKIIDTAVDEYTCPAWIGAFRGMLELTKTNGTVRKTHCQLNGASHCEFIIKWT
jgi:predicted hydrocarbon binding protein